MEVDGGGEQGRVLESYGQARCVLWRESEAERDGASAATLLPSLCIVGAALCCAWVLCMLCCAVLWRWRWTMEVNKDEFERLTGKQIHGASARERERAGGRDCYRQAVGPGAAEPCQRRLHTVGDVWLSAS
jgi:hypothetical protein